MQPPPFPRYLVRPRSKYSPQHHVLKHRPAVFMNLKQIITIPSDMTMFYTQ